jgi:hypothetical protein
MSAAAPGLALASARSENNRCDFLGLQIFLLTNRRSIRGPQMKLLTEYLDHALSFERMAAKKTIEKLERDSKSRRLLIANSPLNARQETGLQFRAHCKNRSDSKAAS